MEKNKVHNGEENESTERVQMPGFRGNIYQSKLLMWYLLTGLSSKDFDFELGTEIDEAGKYDDLVLKYKKIIRGIELDHFLILQSKHRTGKNKIVSHDDVFTDKNVDFGLVKYFNSFVESKNSKMFVNGEIEYAINFTNACFNMEGKIPRKYWGEVKNIESIIEEMKVEEDSFLSKCQIKGGKYYKFKSDIVSPVLKSMILDYEYYKIAQKLYKSLGEGKKLSPDDNILKHCRQLLLTDVIDIESKTFRKAFLNERFNNVNATETQKLRGALDKVLKDSHSTVDKIAEKQFKIGDDFTEPGLIIQSWPTIADADVKEFLDKCVFAMGQPDEMKLGDVILEEIRKQYTKYDTNFINDHFYVEIQSWMKGEKFCIKMSEDISESRFISNNDVKIFFKNAIQKFKKIILKGPTFNYDDLIEKYKIGFDDLELVDILKDFLFSDKQILSIVSQHVMISSIKLYTELINTKTEEFVYVKLSSSNDFLLNSALETFEYETTNLLVIESDFGEMKPDEFTYKMNYIISTLQSHVNKKLIIISNRENLLTAYFSNDFCLKTECVERIDVANNLINLKEDSQNCLSNTKVKFQGSDAELCDFVINDELKKAVDGDMLKQILEKKDIIIGQNIQGLKKDTEAYYINRTFICKVKNGKSIYFVSGIHEGDLCLENYNLRVTENCESLTDKENSAYENAVENNKSSNIYMLRKKGEEFILLKRSKDPFVMTDFMKTINHKCEVNLISAVAGMGKSTLLLKLSQNIKDMNPSLWVVKFDLNAVSTKLKEIKINESNMRFEDIVDLLHHGANHQHALEKKIFENRLQSKNVVLCMDGFDEICPDYKFIVLKIIKILENEAKIEKIWISTRPYDSILNDMNKYFGDCSKRYDIEPFTENDQKGYIERFWMQSIKVEKEYFEKFIVELLKLLNNNIKDKKCEFFGIALHTMLIGITFIDIYEKNQKTNTAISEQQLNELSEMLSLSSLYKQFVSFKYEIYFKDKACLNTDRVAGKDIVKDSRKECMKKCKILALGSLFDEDDLTILLTKNELEDLKKYMNRINDDGDGIGIVTQIGDGKPQFIHRTFAEFFAAMFFVDHLKVNKKESKNVMEYFLKNMTNVKNAVICDFVDSMLNYEPSVGVYKFSQLISEMDVEIFSYVINKGKWEKIAEILIENGINLDCNLLFSLYIPYARLKHKKPLFNLMFEKGKYDKCTLKKHLLMKEINFASPLYYAISKQEIENVKIILEKSKEIGILDRVLMNRDFHFGIILHSMIINNDSEFFTRVIDLLKSEKDILKMLLFVEDREDRTPFDFALHFGRMDRVKILLNLYDELNISKDTVLWNKNKIGENILHRVINSGIKDSSFTDLLKFLINTDLNKLKSLLFEKDNQHRIPFDLSVSSGNMFKFKTILELYGELNVPIDSVLWNENKNGENIIHHVRSYHNSNFFNNLLNILKSKPDKLKSLLLKKDVKGRTLFHVIINRRLMESFKTILDLFDELNISKDSVLWDEDKNNENIIHYAAMSSCNIDFFVYLLNLVKIKPDKSTILFKKNKNGNTPYDLIVLQNNHEKTVIMHNFFDEQNISKDEFLHNETNESSENILDQVMRYFKNLF